MHFRSSQQRALESWSIKYIKLWNLHKTGQETLSIWIWVLLYIQYRELGPKKNKSIHSFRNILHLLRLAYWLPLMLHSLAHGKEKKYSVYRVKNFVPSSFTYISWTVSPKSFMVEALSMLSQELKEFLTILTEAKQELYKTKI